MSARELDRAGVSDRDLRLAYEECRRLNARHGRTYFLATRLLSPAQRPAVHALYGFARWADDIVDDPGVPGGLTARAAALDELERRFGTAWQDGRGGHPVVDAVVDTARRYGIGRRHFTDFLASMRMDLHVEEYPTFQELMTYVHGSAAVIGLQCLPVLRTVGPQERAAPHAAGLGTAFQITNFIRDVGEDLDRGRIYLPADQLASHGVDRDLLMWCRRTGRGSARVAAALRERIAHTRGLYRYASLGVPILAPASRPCVAAALVLYRRILDEVERHGVEVVLHRRVCVSRGRRAAVAARGAAGAAVARFGAAAARRGGR
ncbi:phytoene/squalene synthase family protein [Streptomyces sp. BE20]|uniref:phytoene/squalene synthase family protein n=1 Tax=Streptomyces sp. BE20 TaxID=3002525 RepID=UPI002E7A5C97|nr:phytoene/squalene synthase family protein [Streptomyces sp. BE20]MEE1822934.1 phytoene/squalene synthase family protein [Streptomyces sp. BE20]